jgi:hypothetical protein
MSRDIVVNVVCVDGYTFKIAANTLHILKKKIMEHFIEMLKQKYCDASGIARDKLQYVDYAGSEIYKEEYKSDWKRTITIHNDNLLTEWIKPLVDCGINDNDIITVVRQDDLYTLNR